METEEETGGTPAAPGAGRVREAPPWSLWREHGPGTHGPHTSGLQDGENEFLVFHAPSSWSRVVATPAEGHALKARQDSVARAPANGSINLWTGDEGPPSPRLAPWGPCLLGPKPSAAWAGAATLQSGEGCTGPVGDPPHRLGGVRGPVGFWVRLSPAVCKLRTLIPALGGSRPPPVSTARIQPCAALASGPRTSFVGRSSCRWTACLGDPGSGLRVPSAPCSPGHRHTGLSLTALRGRCLSPSSLHIHGPAR